MIIAYANRTLRLKKPFANLRQGETVFLIGIKGDYCFLFLPKGWLGVNQVKITFNMFYDIIDIKNNN